jgi:hypothetical protein
VCVVGKGVDDENEEYGLEAIEVGEEKKKN